ncbi:hypothetical protein CSOJ01_14545 [Colletotrichum sojae]|uniref:Uncharacterized protein n=1 Tax=Colletotrichum sojae TaxID=2175907 RepID=A0A8H6MK02_9PEZI|nr:hypothetical protein CSOJ01_14545 [Colletotrichum sojae]
MHLSSVIIMAAVVTTSLASVAQPPVQLTERQETCASLWEIALSVRQGFITKRATINPLGLVSYFMLFFCKRDTEAYDRFLQYYESGMYNMLESCGLLQSFRYPPRSDRRQQDNA